MGSVVFIVFIIVGIAFYYYCLHACLQIVLNEKLAKIEEELVVASAKTEEYKGSVFALQLNESELQYQNRDISMQFENAESTNKSLSNINSNILEKLNEIKSELEMEVKMNTKISTKLEEVKSELKKAVTVSSITIIIFLNSHHT